MHNMLEATHYNTGKRYEDFLEGTDKLAEFGLAALVTGIAANKLGLLSMAGVFLLKIWKLIVLGCVILTGIIKKFFRRAGKISQKPDIFPPVDKDQK